MKKKSNQKAAKIAKRLAARAAAVEQPTSTDGAVGNDGTGGAVGEEGGPGVGWSAADTQEVGQVRVVVGLCSRIDFRTATEYPPIHVLFSNKPSNSSNASSLLLDRPSRSPNPDLCGGADGSEQEVIAASAAGEVSCGKPEAL